MLHRPRTAVAVLVAMLALLAGSAVAAADDYVALGDSYSSGVGTRTFYESTCKRSDYAYPRLVGANRANTTLAFEACSGAETGDVLSEQLEPLSSSTDIVTITIGGNDAGFADVITQCALPWPWSCGDELDDAEAFIEGTLPGLLDDVYDAIDGDAPNATVVVLGYPRLFMGVDCNGGTFFSSTELRRMNEVADLLAGVTSSEASAAGFTFKDAIPSFTGHAVCSEAEWINGLSSPVEESFHPNRAGHASGYEPLVREVIG